MNTSADKQQHFARSPLDTLRDGFKQRKEKNASYSLTSFARDLGISKSLLSKVLLGQRPISLKLSIQISTALDLNESQSQSLILSVIQSSGKNAKISKKIKQKLENDLAQAPKDDAMIFTTIEIERFKAMASWHHLALINLTTLDAFQNDPIWISKQLGITTVEVVEAIERLISIGLLHEHQGKLQRSNKSMFIKTQKSEFAIRNFHDQMINKAKEELKETSQEHFNRRMINGITFVCGQDQIALIKDKIDKFQDEILALASTGDCDDVHQMNFQFFPLTNTQLNGDNK